MDCLGTWYRVILSIHFQTTCLISSRLSILLGKRLGYSFCCHYIMAYTVVPCINLTIANFIDSCHMRLTWLRGVFAKVLPTPTFVKITHTEGGCEKIVLISTDVFVCLFFVWILPAIQRPCKSDQTSGSRSCDLCPIESSYAIVKWYILVPVPSTHRQKGGGCSAA